jgi:hypothetical protein
MGTDDIKEAPLSIVGNGLGVGIALNVVTQEAYDFARYDFGPGDLEELGVLLFIISYQTGLECGRRLSACGAADVGPGISKLAEFWIHSSRRRLRACACQ